MRQSHTSLVTPLSCVFQTVLNITIMNVSIIQHDMKASSYAVAGCVAVSPNERQHFGYSWLNRLSHAVFPPKNLDSSS